MAKKNLLNVMDFGMSKIRFSVFDKELKQQYSNIKTVKYDKGYLNQKKYFIGSNGNLILSNSISNNSNLPSIFGKFNINNYLNLRKELKKYGIDNNKIIKYFFHKSKRWDLIYENNIIIQLPNKNLVNALNLFNDFKKKNLIKPNSTIDLRINNRITLKNG